MLGVTDGGAKVSVAEGALVSVRLGGVAVDLNGLVVSEASAGKEGAAVEVLQPTANTSKITETMIQCLFRTILIKSCSEVKPLFRESDCTC